MLPLTQSDLSLIAKHWLVPVPRKQTESREEVSALTKESLKSKMCSKGDKTGIRGMPHRVEKCHETTLIDSWPRECAVLKKDKSRAL